jgi:S-adenosyl-L-methionine hydrolase (adenosine-forming)
MAPYNQARLPEQIALFTDFGEAGPYMGQMEAVLFNLGVKIPVIRLLSDAPKCDPRASAYLLEPLSKFQPKNTLFLSVVDPGVGSSRLPLVVQTEQHWFVGPDNGLFSQVLKQAKRIKVQSIDWQPERLSESFHGRDLFAPVAASISQGSAIPLLPVNPSELIGGDWPDCLSEVVYIDHYGNAFTGIGADKLADDVRLSVGGVEIVNSRIFTEKDRGQPFWYRNSIGVVEIAVNQGRADGLLGLKIGQRVMISC